MTRRLLTLAAVSAAAATAVAQPPGFPTPVATESNKSSAVQAALERKAKMPAAPTPQAVPTVAAPAAAPAAAPPATAANTMVIKTAGQPDRKVQVLRTERMPDGKTMTEVKDVATGEKYTLIDNPTGVPAESKPALPKVMAPLVGKATTPRMPTGETVPTPEVKPTIMSRLFGTKPTAATTAPMPVTTTPMKPMPVVKTPAMPAPMTAMPMAKQPAMSAPVLRQPPVMTPPAVVIPSAATEPTFVLKQPPVPADAIRVTLPADEIPPEVTMKEEVAPLIADLMTHRRPSYRMEAASGLADGRYGSRDEIKGVLAKAAAADASPVVRAHCIGLLSNLGYADPTHVQMLKTCASDDSPALSRAARTALEKMK